MQTGAVEYALENVMVAIVPALAGLLPAVTLTVPFAFVALDIVTVAPVPAPEPPAIVGVPPPAPQPVHVPVIFSVPATVSVWPVGTVPPFKTALDKVGDAIAGAVLVTILLPVPDCPVRALAPFRTRPLATRSQFGAGPVTARPPTETPPDVPTVLPMTVEHG